MAKMSALQVEIAKVEDEINGLARLKALIAKGTTPEDMDRELNVLEQVRGRLQSALPATRTRKPREAKPVNAAKPNGKGKQASA